MDATLGRRRFHTTKWSLVRSAGDQACAGFEAALTSLCEMYWHPVYGYIRRSGRSAEDARDLTQAFFVRVLETALLKSARPDRGRFRSFLLASLRNFLINEYHREHTVKRGGHQPHLSLEFDAEEQRYQLEPVDSLTPDHVYECRWAASIFENAMQRLTTLHAASPRRHVFEQLRVFVLDGGTPSNELASELGLSPGALRVALHRLRKQYETVLEDVIAETVERPEDVADELRHLLKVVSR